MALDTKSTEKKCSFQIPKAVARFATLRYLLLFDPNTAHQINSAIYDLKHQAHEQCSQSIIKRVTILRWYVYSHASKVENLVGVRKWRLPHCIDLLNGVCSSISNSHIEGAHAPAQRGCCWYKAFILLAIGEVLSHLQSQ